MQCELMKRDKNSRWRRYYERARLLKRDAVLELLVGSVFVDRVNLELRSKNTCRGQRHTHTHTHTINLRLSFLIDKEGCMMCA